MSHNVSILNVNSCGEAAARSKNWVKWANLGIFCYFLPGDAEKCELTTNYVIKVSEKHKNK